ncbi:MAG: homospermidine synthase [Proteobacteria bacterium]|nr:homospermidine synthase [Burkholderiales bacterium]
MSEHTQYAAFKGRMLILGFGSIGQGSLPLLMRHVNIAPGQITIVSAHDSGRDIAERYGVRFINEPVTRDNYSTIYGRHLARGDFLVNASVDVGSVDSIEWCQRRGVLYLDACIEPWAGGHTDMSIDVSRRTNYAHRERALALRSDDPAAPTAVVMHGANPGLVSHFVKQALLELAAESGFAAQPRPERREQWAALAQRLGIRTIQVSERDHQTTDRRKAPDEFCNTWSSDAFAGESLQPAEMGWGTHERHFPHDARRFDFGCGSSIFLDRTGCTTRVRSWAPQAGPFHGYLISHGEAHSIADFLSVRDGTTVRYRPTCYYAYHPCADAVASLEQFVESHYRLQPVQRLLRDELTGGVDELGVLLCGHPRGAYWYGSQLSVAQARKLAPYNNATGTQVNIGFVGAIIWAIRNPTAGIVEPEQVDDRLLMEIATPYLGRLGGNFTDWTPLVHRGELFPEDIDRDDPWQFKNFRITT